MPDRENNETMHHVGAVNSPTKRVARVAQVMIEAARQAMTLYIDA
jgi:hypothetical protein